MNKPEAVICIGGGPSQLPLIKEISDLEYTLIVIDRNKESPGFQYADEVIQLSTFDGELIIESIKKFQDKYKFVGIINRSSGIPVITTSRIAKYLNLPNISPQMATTIVNKDLLRIFCKDHQVLIPDFKIYHPKEKPSSDNLNFPVIAKPALSIVGKSGVSVANSHIELQSALDNAIKFSVTKTALIESFVEGIDIELVGFVKNKKLEVFCMVEEINLMRKSGEIYGKGMKIYDECSNQHLANLCIHASNKIIDLFNIEHSPFMSAFRVNSSGAYLIELHLDIGGDLLLEHLLPYSLSCNYAKVILNYCVNSNYSLKKTAPLPAAIIFDEGSNLVTEKSFNLIKADNFLELDQLVNIAMNAPIDNITSNKLT